MESVELTFMIAAIIGLMVFLIHFLSKRASTSLANADERTFEISKKLGYYTLKWVTILFLIAMAWNLTMSWPPHWLERRQQRRIVLERAQEAGGWQAIKTDCEAIVAAGATNRFNWMRGWEDAPPLPKSLTALQPRTVDISPEKDGKLSVRIQVFGMHSTGGRGQDYYILKIVCPRPPNAPPSFKADPEAKVKYGNRKITDGVYEVTRRS